MTTATTLDAAWVDMALINIHYMTHTTLRVSPPFTKLGR